jgi:hypothetical protein
MYHRSQPPAQITHSSAAAVSGAVKGAVCKNKVAQIQVAWACSCHALWGELGLAPASVTATNTWYTSNTQVGRQGLQQEPSG